MSKLLARVTKKELSVVLACAAVFLGLIFVSVNRFSVWHDEGYTATLIENNYSGIIERTALDVHPPLYYLLLKTWSFAFGNSVLVLRSFSAVCMLGAILLTWWLIRKLYGVKAGYAALAAMAFGPFLVRYGQEMRMYGLAALLAALATHLYVKTLAATKVSKSLAVGYGLVIVAGMYTQYFFVLVPMVHAIHAYLSQGGSIKERIGSLKKYLLSIVVAALLFAPWIPTVLGQFSDVYGAFWIGPVSVETLTSTPVAMTYFNKQYEMSGIEGLVAVLTIAAIVVVLRQFFLRHKDKASRLLFMSVVLPPVLLFIMSVPPFQPSYQDRYMSFFAPVFYSLLAIGTLLITSKKVRYSLGIFLAAVLLHGQYANYWDGNNHGWSPKPSFTMNQIIDRVNDGAPIYSTSLWTYFDAHITVKDRGISNSAQLLLDGYPVQWGGNWSAVYKRPELLTESVAPNAKSFWLIDESGSNQYHGKALDAYTAGTTFTSGYAKITQYTKQ